MITVPTKHISEMHPADIANIISQVHSEERTAIFASLSDKTAAEALHELEPKIQALLLTTVDTKKALGILDKMPVDEVADVLGDIPMDRAEELLRFMKPKKSAQVRKLLKHPEETAGGLMTTEFISMPRDFTVQQTIEKMRDESRLEQLRSQLTEPQWELLNEFWKYYRQNGKWPPTRSVHSRRGKRAVRECLQGLGGDIVMEAQDSTSGNHYELTIIGVLLTDEGRTYFAMLAQYLEFLRKQYKEAPERLDFSHEDFREPLRLSDEQLKTLGDLVRLGHLWAGGSSSYGNDSWSVQPPHEIEDMPDDKPLDEPLEDLLFRRFQRGKAVFFQERQRQILSGSFPDPNRVDKDVISPDTGIAVDVLKRRYQVFVSSTYEDLKEERQHVIQALLETKCIPVGMELFPAASVEQWKLIKRVIEECDYYLVIIAGRYGSVDQSGVGYTEREFDYAVSIGKPVIGFYHK